MIINEQIKSVCERLSIQPSNQLLIVDIDAQEMHLLKNEEIISTYTISTSERPPSCKVNSYGTPWGLHKVEQKIGADQPKGMVFRGRKSIGKTFENLTASEQEKDLITSRILWLEGMESGVNNGPECDSFERYIYIHGTNHENDLGKPKSMGCVRMANEDVIKLYDLVDEGTLVWIPEPAQA